MNVTFTNSRISERFCCIKDGTIFMNNKNEIFIKGFYKDVDFAINVSTGEISSFFDNTLVYPLPNAELIIN